METSDGSHVFSERRMRLILIGKTGAGKSATGNTILGADVFKSQAGVNSETKDCGVAITKRGGQEILVMDTPGLCDTDGEDGVIAQRITQSLFAVAPGPHAVILVLRCDSRFTDQEVKVFNLLKEVFGPKMTSHMIVIFVGKDELDKRKISFETQLARSEKLQGVLQEADNRYLLFNNEGDVHEKNLMVGSLMQMVKDVVARNGGGCFRHRISRELDESMARMVKEEVRERTGESMPVIREEAERPRPKRVAPKPPRRTKIPESTRPVDKAKIPESTKPVEAEASTKAEAEKETKVKAKSGEDDVSHADQQAVNRKQEMRDLHCTGAVKARLEHFSKPEPTSPDPEKRQRTPVSSPQTQSSVETKDTQGQEKPPREIQTQTSEESSEMPSPPQSPLGDPEEPAAEDVVCNWNSDDTRVEEVLDSLQDQLVRELRTSDDDDATFVYDVPDKPGMTLAQKQRLVEDALRRKIIHNPEALNEAQREELKKAVKTVGHKIKEGMAKFALKTIDKCLVM